MTMQHIEIDVRDGIAELVLNRPKVNAMSQALLGEMASSFRTLAQDDAVRGLLVHGAGKCLSAGLDLIELGSMDEANVDAFLDVFDEAFTAPFAFPKPMAVSVHGHAIAGGMVLALCADHLVWGEGDYKVGLTELAVGVPFPRCAFEIVRTAMTPQALRILVNGAATHPPAAVFALGVGDALVPEPLDEAKRWLAMACSRPLETFCYVKKQRRQEAWERIQRRSLDERQRLKKAIVATRAVIAGTLR